MRRRNMKHSNELLHLENKDEHFHVEKKSTKFSKFSISATTKNANIQCIFEVENKNLHHH